MDENVTNDAVLEAAQLTETEAPQEQVENDTTVEQTETAETESSTETSQTEQEDTDEEIDWSQYVTPASAPLPTDEQGQIDPNQFREQVKREMRFEMQETQAWQRLEKQYPEIRKDAELRDLIVANRLYDVQRGGNGSLDASAERIMSRLGVAKNQGRAAQQTSVTVQKSAALEKPSGVQQKASSSDEAVAQRIRMGDQSAIQSALSNWIENGKI